MSYFLHSFFINSFIVYIFVFYLGFLFGSIYSNGKGFLSGQPLALLKNCIGQENVYPTSDVTKTVSRGYPTHNIFYEVS